LDHLFHVLGARNRRAAEFQNLHIKLNSISFTSS
jgi:hypothetical protein